jgi:transposase
LSSAVTLSGSQVGGAPTYLLTDNARTVTMDHVAGIPVRHPEMVALGRHYGCKVETCVPFDPESKGGAEASVRVAQVNAFRIFGHLDDPPPDFPVGGGHQRVNNAG